MYIQKTSKLTCFE